MSMAASKITTKLILMCGAAVVAFPQYAAAQNTVSEDVIIVTGTNIRGPGYDAPVPAEVLNASDIEAAGVITTTDLLNQLTVNTGSEFNTFGFSQNNTAGTSQVNLRGLGLGATLTLLNGRRMTTNASFADDGSTFVDVNTIPLLMIDRVEVVKSGSSAIYGSDAVAGVVNFISRNRFEGLELSGSYQTTTEGSQEDISIDGIFGFGDDRANLTVAASYFDRSPLTFADRDFTNTGTELENIGNPGSFILIAPSPLPGLSAIPTGVPIPDPGCVQAGGVVQALAPPPAPVGFCLTDSRDFQNLAADEERLSLFADFRYDLSDTASAFFEVQAANNATDTLALRSLPGLASPVILPPFNPGNPFGAPAVFIGRPLGLDDGLADSNFRSDTLRFSGGVSAEIAADWQIDLSAVRGKNDFQTTVNDLRADRVAQALLGQAPGGFLNPGTQGPATPESVAEFVSVELINDFTASTDVLSANLSGTLAELPGGALGVAVGYQYRDQTSGFTPDPLLREPAGTLTFLPGVAAFEEASLDVHAGYIELGAPITDKIDVQAALRYEDYGGSIGDTLDPKIAIGIELLDSVTLRGSAGTSFRAPTPLQTDGATSQVTPIINPCTGQRSAAAIITAGNDQLKPEDSTSYAAGLAFQGNSGLRASVDYYRYDYEDIITRNDPQGIASAATCSQVAPGVVVPVGSGVNLNPRTGQIASISTQFFNAGAIETDGMDVNIGYRFGDGMLNGLDIDLRGTLINTFDLTPVAGEPTIDAVDNRNALNFARSTPNFRGNARLLYELDMHQFGVTARYIDGYTDDLNDASIDSHLTFDLQYGINLSDISNIGKSTRLVIGAINVTDEDPPFVNDRGGYDPLVADPRGRVVYAKLRQAF